MNKKTFNKVLTLIASFILVTSLGGVHTAYATNVSTIDMDMLYNTLIVGDMSYATSLYYQGTIDAYMATDADGIEIYVPDDPKGGTGTGVGIYRQDNLIAENHQYGVYTIYYGEFVSFNRHGHGSIYKTYKDASYTFTRSFYGYWEDDYPNGQGNESYTEETTGQNKKVKEVSGVYIKDRFTGTINTITSEYAGSSTGNEGITTWVYPYVNGYAEGTVSWTVQDAGKPLESGSYQMLGGYLVNDRTDEYFASHSANDFDPQTMVIAAWTEQNNYYIPESKVEPRFYDYSDFMALK
jgi:hypothetical protein